MRVLVEKNFEKFLLKKSLDDLLKVKNKKQKKIEMKNKKNRKNEK